MVSGFVTIIRSTSFTHTEIEYSPTEFIIGDGEGPIARSLVLSILPGEPGKSGRPNDVPRGRTWVVFNLIYLSILRISSD